MKSSCINGKVFEWSIISRRSCFRAGVRYYVRGNFAPQQGSQVTVDAVRSVLSKHLALPTQEHLAAVTCTGELMLTTLFWKDFCRPAQSEVALSLSSLVPTSEFLLHICSLSLCRTH